MKMHSIFVKAFSSYIKCTYCIVGLARWICCFSSNMIPLPISQWTWPWILDTQAKLGKHHMEEKTEYWRQILP